MPTYIVSYDLRSPGEDYDCLIEYLKTLTRWWHNLGSTWVVVTRMTAEELHDEIKKHADSNDKVLVVESAGAGAWSGFRESGSAWLTNYL